MSRKKQTRGNCTYCGRTLSKAGMLKHLATCPQRLEVVQQSAGRPGDDESIFQLRVQDAWRGDYWLDLEMKGSATLKQLDHYLREIWLECCGHLSHFSTSGWGSGELPKSWRAQRVFEPGDQLTHLYDYGTTSETLIRVIAVRRGKPTTRHAIALLARNLPPEAECIVCGEPAAWLCMECLCEDEVWGALCDRHVKDHPHEDYGEPFPLVNSPRMGMCGYTGPADPPY